MSRALLSRVARVERLVLAPAAFRVLLVPPGLAGLAADAWCDAQTAAIAPETLVIRVPRRGEWTSANT